VEGSWEQGNEPSGSIKCWEILEYHSSDWRLLKRDSAVVASLLALRDIGPAWFGTKNPTMVTWTSIVEQYVETFTSFNRALWFLLWNASSSATQRPITQRVVSADALLRHLDGCSSLYFGSEIINIYFDHNRTFGWSVHRINQPLIIQLYADNFSTLISSTVGHAIARLVPALCYMPEASGFQPHYGPGIDSASNRNEYQESSWWAKERQARKVDNLTAICEPIVQKSWDPRRLTNPIGLHGLLKDSFTFLPLFPLQFCTVIEDRSGRKLLIFS
jgi:hypothetical protein